MSSLVSANDSPDPCMLLPTCFDVPVGSLKYPPTATCTCLLLFNNHNTMNSAIIAVTKSAYALGGSRCRRFSAAPEHLLRFLKRRSHMPRDRAPSDLYRHDR